MNNEALKEFCREAGIELVVLFGSAARGSEQPKSDVDIALKLKRGLTVSKLDLIYNFGRLFNDREIDLVILSINTDPVLLYEIFSHGKPLFEGKADIFAEERLRAFKLYFDTEKLRLLQADYLRKFAERVRHVA